MTTRIEKVPKLRALARSPNRHEGAWRWLSETLSALPQAAYHQTHPVGKCLYGDLLPFLTHVVVRDESQVFCTGLDALAGFHRSNRSVLIRLRRIDRGHDLL